MDFIVSVFQKGGPIMWILAGLSIMGLAIFLERLTSLRREKIIPSSMTDRIRQLISEKKIEEALQICKLTSNPVTRLVTTLLQNRTWNKLELRAHMEDMGRQEAQKLGQNIHFLNTIAAVGPLLGLLGTVFGMIRTFQVVNDAGLGNPEKLAGGIALALYTTAGGLTVAVPMLLAYKFIYSRVVSFATNLENFVTEILEKI